MHIMKFRVSRKLQNMILSINFAILTFFRVFFFCQIFWNISGLVGMKIFLFFFWKAIEMTGSAQKKNRVGRVSGNTGIFRPH